MRMPLLLSAAIAALFIAHPAFSKAPEIGVVKPKLETETLTESDLDADADDPAVWVAPGDGADSLVVTAVKNGGVRVYDLKGKLVQRVDPAPDGGRINNVDVVYGLKLADGSKIDAAIASDRGLDVIRIFKIERPENANDDEGPLVEITAKNPRRAFPQRPKENGKGLEDNPLEDQNTVYGLTAIKDPESGAVFAVGTQRGQPRLGVFRLVPRKGGTVEAVYFSEFRVPVVHKGQNLREENENDPLKDWSPQFEGLAVDLRAGVLYAGQEDVGIWRIPIRVRSDMKPKLIYETRGSKESSFHNPDSVISRDVEGLCVFYGEDDNAYLIASSQGNAHGDAPTPDAPYDDSFVVFKLKGDDTPELIGSFRVGKGKKIDAVQESDGPRSSPSGCRASRRACSSRRTATRATSSREIPRRRTSSSCRGRRSPKASRRS
ncbi:phytase [Chenggangzhangella methanolivorans]|uniref:Phytase n=1 Tax=Chenggangzhangella methanolivorans TaxID=1437009 RepID=A0A9E6UIK9_9HYPH|nr:phytase [Chenggangzhangella methanolivorans]QZO00978.1 phytase [Chenggangzhangella methanolivorans]